MSGILVTGASRGIGAALLAHYRGAGRKALGTCRPANARPPLLPLDVADPASHAALAETLAGGPIGLLVCNAGIYPDRFEALEGGFPAAMWAETFAVNVAGVFLAVQALLPNLRAAGRPRIAIVASRMGSSARARGGSYIYRASKAAAANLARNLATDLASDGIAVGAYHPGWVRTDMTGPEADLDAAEAAAGLAARFEALDLATSGIFEDHAGRPLVP